MLLSYRFIIKFLRFFMTQVSTIFSGVFEQGMNVVRQASFDKAQAKLDNSFAVFEEGLNIAGYIPLFGLSRAAGFIRIEFGKALIIGSIAVAALVVVASLFNRDIDAKNQSLRLASKIVQTYALHGLANIGRGCVEIGGYITLIPRLFYDLTNNRYKYPNEVAGRWEYVRT